MPVKRLTDLSIRKLPAPPEGQVTYWDDTLPNFGVRVSYKGTRAFVLMYYEGNHRKRRTLGRHPILSLARAREAARATLANITLGHPVGNQKATDKADITFAEALRLFETLYLNTKNKERTAYETKRLLKRHFSSKLRTKLLKKIEAAHIAAIIDDLLDKPSLANHAFAAIRKFFNWCVERHYITASPCARMKMPTKTSARERVLSDDEVKAIYNAAVDTGHPFGSIIQLLILTAQRRNEVAAMQWNHINLEERLWAIPPEFNKSNRPHAVPLTDASISLIKKLPRINDTLVFPARGNPDNTFSGFSKSKKALDTRSNTADWTLHDIRRTVATKMAQIDIPPHVVEKLLNHVSGSISGVAAIYNRYAYEAEMRAALAAWEKHLESLLRSNRS